MSASRVAALVYGQGEVYTARPLPIAYERKCIFMPLVVRTLDAAGIRWETPYLADV